MALNGRSTSQPTSRRQSTKPWPKREKAREVCHPLARSVIGDESARVRVIGRLKSIVRPFVGRAQPWTCGRKIRQFESSVASTRRSSPSYSCDCHATPRQPLPHESFPGWPPTIPLSCSAPPVFSPAACRSRNETLGHLGSSAWPWLNLSEANQSTLLEKLSREDCLTHLGFWPIPISTRCDPARNSACCFVK